MDVLIFRALADSYEGIQKFRVAAEGRLRAMEQHVDETEETRIRMMERVKDFKEIENKLRLDMTYFLSKEPIYTEFFQNVKGIGPTLACKLLALDMDIDRELTSWNAYFGLVTHYWMAQCEDGCKRFYAKDPIKCLSLVGEKLKICDKPIVEKEHIEHQAPKRKRGWRGFDNPRARKLIYLISTQFLKGGKFYKEQYYRFKEREVKTKKDWSKGRIDNSAKRKAVQLFLAHWYQASCDLIGKEYRIPYQFEYLKHDDFILWTDVVSYEKAKKAA